jgi:hypothetical protein
LHSRDPAGIGARTWIRFAGQDSTTMTRDPRLDVFRGLALVIILIDHLPGNFWAQFTLGNWGFSDAAEGFVLIAGIAAGLAYGSYFRDPTQILAGTGRIWGRVWTIYLVQIFITVLALGLAVLLAHWFANPAMLQINQVNAFFADPQSGMVRLPLLAQHLDYVDILPVYVALLAATPFMLLLAWRAPLLLLALSVGLWMVTDRWQLNLPSHPNPAGWFFNPLAWQLIFVVGLLTGVALKDGRRLVPVTGWLLVPALAILVLGGVMYTLPSLAGPLWDWHWRAGQAGAPDILIGLEKTFLPLPRILHALALAYVLSCFAFVSTACASRPAAPFALLGRNALPVFAAISILNFAMQLVRVETGEDFWRDTAMLVAALAVIFALAAAREFWPAVRAGARSPAAPASATARSASAAPEGLPQG